MTANINNNLQSYQNFKILKDNAANDLVQKPIEKTSAIINDTFDKFTNENESKEKKDNRKKVIGITSSVLVLSTLMLLFNPKVSPKITKYLKNISEEAKNNIEKNKNNPIISTYYKTKAFLATAVNKGSEFINTANSSKDYLFDWLCCAKKGENIKNNTLNKVVTTIDKGFRTVMEKPHKAITKFFDNIGKSTVIRKNKNAANDLDVIINLIEKYKSKLSTEEITSLEKDLKKIKNYKESLSKDSVNKRLLHQEELMTDLKSKFGDKLKEFRKGFKFVNSEGSMKDITKHNVNHLSDNMTFWTKDILQTTKDDLERAHLNQIETILGTSQNKNGALNKISDLILPKLNELEKTELQSKINVADKSIKNAHKTEFLEYFDKKRDLTMGGAPTDILSALTLLGLSGITITKADTKEEKLSKSLTVATPVVLGLGSNMALTAMLFSGTQAMLIGSGISTVLSTICNAVDKAINPKAHIKNVTKDVR